MRMLNARRLVAAITLAALVGAVIPGSAAGAGFLTLIKSGFSSPVFVTHAGDARLFVVEQGGRIKVIHSGTVSTFLDIRNLVLDGGERGLLGLAFHPNYASNGRFYVNYTREGDGATVVAEFRRSAGDPNRAKAASKRQLLLISQPFANHNGGWLAFKGKYLYISTGDGGGSGDPGNRAQDKSTLLGKILRINPLDPDGSGPKRYAVPRTNPFVGVSGRDEIWSYGLRNPWRCSFDRKTKYLWCADVGQGAYEEVNRSTTGRGLNYGWRLLEGFHYYNYPGRTQGKLCTSGCKTLPIAEYAHSSGRCSVTGGYVARRSGADLYGKYVFGDYCSGDIWVIGAGFERGNSLPAARHNAGFQISSFGENKDGRLFVVDIGNGRIYRINGS